MIAALLLVAALATPPTPLPPPSVAPVPETLPQDPASIAHLQFVAFALDDINASFYTDPPSREQVAAGKRLVLQAGRIKGIEFLERFDSRYGAGYAYRFVCEHGSLVERFTLRSGKITSIDFAKK